MRIKLELRLHRSERKVGVALKEVAPSKCGIRASGVNDEIAIDRFEDKAIFPKLEISIELAVGQHPLSWLLQMPMESIIAVARKKLAPEGVVDRSEKSEGKKEISKDFHGVKDY